MNFKRFFAGAMAAVVMLTMVPAFAMSATADTATSVKIDENHFPDYSFRYRIQTLEKIISGTSANGILEPNEIAQIKTLDLNSGNASQLESLIGINYLTSLETIKLSELPKLERLYLDNNASVKTVTLYGMENFLYINLDNSVVESLSIIKETGFTYLQLHDLPNLKYLTITSNSTIKTIDLYNLPSLIKVGMSEVDIEKIQLDTPSLENIVYIDSKWTTPLDLTSCSNLKSLDVRRTNGVPVTVCGGSEGIIRAVKNGGKGIGNKSWQYSSTYSGKSCVIYCDSNSYNDEPWNKITYDPDGGIPVNIDNFPDRQFRLLVRQDLDTNENYILSPSEISSITALNVENSGVVMRDFTGIEYFTSLKELNLSNVIATTIDLSSNVALEVLTAQNTSLQSINVSNLANLKNIDLKGSTKLTSIDVSTNPNLEVLSLISTSVSSIDIRNNTKLRELYCYDNFVTSIYIGKNPVLAAVWDAPITLSGTKTYTANVNAENGNSYSYKMAAPNMHGTIVEKGIHYQSNISIINKPEEGWIELSKEKFPDDNFRSILAYRYDFNNDLFLSPAEIASIEELNVVYEGIRDLTGIEYLTSITSLTVSFNPDITTINTSTLVNLVNLSAEGTYLESLDLSKNTKLESLNIIDTAMTTLDISNNPNLDTLYAHSNDGRVNEIDVNGCPKLAEICTPDNLIKTTADDLGIDGGKAEIWIYKGTDTDAIMILDGKTNVATSVPTPTPDANPTVTAAPSTSTAPTSTPASGVPTAIPTYVPSSSLSVGDFVERCYNVALNRPSDESGYKYWVNRLNGGEACGAQVGYGFIFSLEYTNRQSTDAEFVTDLYSMYFDRKPDTDGYNYWMDKIANGATREEIFAGFANSLEFYNLCNDYGVVQGVYIVGVPNDQQGGVNCFVARLYNICLNRRPDMAGQSGWAQKLIAGEVTGTTCAYGFVFSPEFIGKQPSNEEFVAYMYRAFFGREADEAGFTAWVDQLNSGATYEDVFNGFSGSAEFANLCASYSITT